MKLQITNQTNEQECGVCVLTSLHNYFYNSQINKEEVLNESSITNAGMTLFDFESLAQKMGIDCESYEIEWTEFLNLNIKNYFVALVSTKDGQSNHYIIVEKHKRKILIYDSCSFNKKELTLSQFKNMFLNVIILVNKKPNKLFSKAFSNVKTVLLFDLKFVLVNILLSILILGSSILAASFLNWIIDSSILKNSINNLISISFIFLIVYFSNDLLTYIESLYVSSQMKNYYLIFTNKILSNIEYKKSDFLNKVDKNWIFKVDECVYSISNFCVLEINKFITNIIFSCICICVVGSVQVYMLIFVLAFALIELIPFLFAYRKKKELFTQTVRAENKNANYYKKLIQSLSFETWQEKRNSLILEIKENYSKIYKNFNDAIIFRSNNNLFKSLVKSLAEISLIACASFLIIKQNHLTIGKLTFIIATFSLYKNSINELFNYFLVKLEFNVYWQVYKDLTDVSNLSNTKITSDEIKNIKFVCEDSTYEITNKKTNLISVSIQNLLNESRSIKFNDQNIDKNCRDLFNKLIVLDQNTAVNLQMFVNLLTNNPTFYATYLRKLKININDQVINYYDQMLINLLCLLENKNKIIIIDSIMPYFKHKDQDAVKDILNILRKNNSLFIVGKDEND